MANRKTELVVAMDFQDKTVAFNLAQKLREKPVILKIGWMLYPYIGHDGLIELSEMFNGRLFLDFKLHDIPSVIANGVESLMKTVNFEIITLHTAGGRDMMEQSIESRDNCFSEGSRCTKKPLLLGVTVLTSMPSTVDEVLDLATLAYDSGMDGVVSSVHEVTALKEKFGDEFKVLTPGIRPEGTDKGDQARVATPSEAKKMGSDFIVVGRPITKSNDPINVVEQILHEIE